MRGRAEPGTPALAGRQILAVEDDFLVLLEIATVLANAGAEVTKCTTVAQALQAIDQAKPLDAAVLDVRLRNETIAPVARKLAERGTPFLFYTGQVTSHGQIAQWPDVRIVSKPALPDALINEVAELLRSSATPHARGR